MSVVTLFWHKRIVLCSTKQNLYRGCWGDMRGEGTRKVLQSLIRGKAKTCLSTPEPFQTDLRRGCIKKSRSYDHMICLKIVFSEHELNNTHYVYIYIYIYYNHCLLFSPCTIGRGTANPEEKRMRDFVHLAEQRCLSLNMDLRDTFGTWASRQTCMWHINMIKYLSHQGPTWFHNHDQIIET